jgi:hypothetical protein
VTTRTTRQYTRSYLRGAAIVALEARDTGSPLWTQLVLAMMLRTGLDADDVELGIQALAR